VQSFSSGQVHHVDNPAMLNLLISTDNESDLGTLCLFGLELGLELIDTDLLFIEKKATVFGQAHGQPFFLSLRGSRRGLGQADVNFPFFYLIKRCKETERNEKEDEHIHDDIGERHRI
jgi:hypothetical protein